MTRAVRQDVRHSNGITTEFQLADMSKIIGRIEVDTILVVVHEKVIEMVKGWKRWAEKK